LAASEETQTRDQWNSARRFAACSGDDVANAWKLGRACWAARAEIEASAAAPHREGHTPKPCAQAARFGFDVSLH
jgi:hypothetical protein